MNPSRISAVVLTFVLLTGCKPDAAKNSAVTGGDAKPADGQPSIAPSAIQNVPSALSSSPAATGSISGTVTLSGKPPKKIAIDTSMDPACSISSPAPVFTEQYSGNTGKLANVFVYVKDGPPAALQAGPFISQPTVLDQKGCQYTPHVVAVMAGGNVQFRNSDVTMHNIHTMPASVGNQPIDISQGPKGAPIVKQFTRPEIMLPVRCNNHPWMNAFINVSATPFFAVSDASGRFTLNRLPPGDYTIAAVHEKNG